jgi:hypothetical protein
MGINSTVQPCYAPNILSRAQPLLRWQRLRPSWLALESHTLRQSELLPRWRRHGVTRDRVHVVLLMLAHLLNEIAPSSRWVVRVADHLTTRADCHIQLIAMEIHMLVSQLQWRGCGIVPEPTFQALERDRLRSGSHGSVAGGMLCPALAHRARGHQKGSHVRADAL